MSLLLGFGFSCAAGHAVRKGVDIRCGCAGRKGGRVSYTTLARALLITLASALLVFADFAGPNFPSWLLAMVTAISVAPAFLERLYRNRDRARRRARELSLQAEIARQYEKLMTAGR